jgi:hypothetical protein
MATDYNHLSDAAQAALELSNDERCAYITRDRFIVHEQISAIFDITVWLVYKPPCTRARGLLVSAVGGSGKTMLADAILRRYPKIDGAFGVHAALPTLRITMTGAREAKQIYIRVLRELNCPYIEQYTRLQLELKAIDLLKAAHVKLLIIDEVQDIVSGTRFQQRAAFESIKLLMNEAAVAILALGTVDAEKAMRVDPHLHSRFRPYPLGLWETGPLLANFLDELERSLPLKQRSRLSSLGVMRLLISESGGVLDTIVQRVVGAAALAVETGVERVNEELIKLAAWRVPAFASRLGRKRS